MLYFAYGSNLDPAEMNALTPGHRVGGLAVLHDHRLGFPLYSNQWEGGVAGLVHAHGPGRNHRAVAGGTDGIRSGRQQLAVIRGMR